MGGRYHAYACGWLLALGYLSIVPLNATALGVLGTFVAPGLLARGDLYTVAGIDVHLGEVAMASVPIVAVALFQRLGVRGVGRLQVALTALMVGGVVTVGVGTVGSETAAVANLQPGFAPDRSPLSGVLAMVAIAPWLYVGFDTLPQAAEEFDFSPTRGLALMSLAIGAGGLMYAVMILSTAAVVPWPSLIAGEPVWATASAVRTSFGPAGVVGLSVIVCLAVLTGINGFFLAASRLLFGMGRARLLPAWFAQVHPTHHTPTNAITFVAALSLIAPWFGREVIVWVVDMAALGTAVGYLYTCVAATRIAPGSAEGRSYGGGERRAALVGVALSVGFVLLLCVPGMPGFMAAPSWIALSVWLGLGVAFLAGRAREYRTLGADELDRLVLQR